MALHNTGMRALITGASSGIGRELAKLFARDGYNLIVVARNQPQLEELARDLQAQYNVNVLVLPKDLAAPTAAQEIFEDVQQQNLQVDVLVNNAGIQVYGRFAEADTAALLAMIQVNLTALTHLTRLFLPLMIQQGKGKIVNLGSTGSFSQAPLSAVYCATKAYILSLSQALSTELVGTGITVTALCPGVTDTAFITRYGLQNVRMSRSMMSAAKVAEIGYRGLQKGRRVIVTGFGNRFSVSLMRFLVPLLPARWYDRISLFLMSEG